MRAPADGWTDPWRADSTRAGASAASARPTSRSPRSLGRRAAVAIQNAWLHESTQQAAREAEETAALLDTILQTAPVGFAFHDNELRFFRINDALAEMNGVPVEEHIGRSPADILPTLGLVEKRFREILRSGLPVIDEEISGETPAAPGRTRHWLASYYLIHGTGGATPIGSARSSWTSPSTRRGAPAGGGAAPPAARGGEPCPGGLASSTRRPCRTS